MGSAGSSAATPAAAAVTAPPAALERTLTEQAQLAITEQLMRAREQVMRAREDAQHHQQLSEEALNALDSLAVQHERAKLYAAGAAAGAAVLAGALGAAAATIVTRRHQASALARISQASHRASHPLTLSP